MTLFTSTYVLDLRNNNEKTKKLQTCYLCYFVSKSHFEND